MKKNLLHAIAILFTLALSVSGCGTTVNHNATAANGKPSNSLPSTTTSILPSPRSSTTVANKAQFTHPHVFVILMENLGYSAAMSTTELRALASKWAYASNYYATTHPSLPNYLSLIGGSTFSITTDCTGCYVNANNLPTELTQHSISWGAYMESIPSDCYLPPYAPSGLYAGKHDPFRYFDNIRSSKTLCSNIQPLHTLENTLANSSSSLPHFIWITPNICNDGHNCSASVAANWLGSMISKITSSSAWQHNGALYVTWDEGNGGDFRGLTSTGSIAANGGGGHVLTLVIEPGLKHGTILPQLTDHYGLLKSIENNFHVPLLGLSANPRLPTLP